MTHSAADGERSVLRRHQALQSKAHALQPKFERDRASDQAGVRWRVTRHDQRKEQRLLHQQAAAASTAETRDPLRVSPTITRPALPGFQPHTRGRRPWCAVNE